MQEMGLTMCQPGQPVDVAPIPNWHTQFVVFFVPWVSRQSVLHFFRIYMIYHTSPPPPIYFSLARDCKYFCLQFGTRYHECLTPNGCRYKIAESRKVPVDLNSMRQCLAEGHGNPTEFGVVFLGGKSGNFRI